MPGRRPGGRTDARAAARTLGAALALLVLVVGVGFAVQVAGLGRGAHNSMLLARTERALLPYRNSHASIVLAGKHLQSSCSARYQGHRRVTTVSIAGGPRLLEIGNNLVKTDKLAVDEFELAGCPRALRKWIATELKRGSPVLVSKARRAGKPVYAMRVAGSKLGLELFVTRGGFFPVALAIEGGGLSGTSEVHYGSKPAAGTGRTT